MMRSARLLMALRAFAPSSGWHPKRRQLRGFSNRTRVLRQSRRQQPAHISETACVSALVEDVYHCSSLRSASSPLACTTQKGRSAAMLRTANPLTSTQSLPVLALASPVPPCAAWGSRTACRSKYCKGAVDAPTAVYLSRTAPCECMTHNDCYYSWEAAWGGVKTLSPVCEGADSQAGMMGAVWLGLPSPSSISVPSLPRG